MAFTKENAAIYAKRGNEIRWSPEYRMKADQQPEAETPIIPAITPETRTDEFREQTLKRVREHLNLLQDKADDILSKRDMDMKEMRDLAVAIKEIEGIEQRLSGRPGPGNLRPMAPKPAKRQSSYPEPVPQFDVIHESAPVPVPQVVSGDWATELF